MGAHKNFGFALGSLDRPQGASYRKFQDLLYKIAHLTFVYYIVILISYCPLLLILY